MKTNKQITQMASLGFGLLLFGTGSGWANDVIVEGKLTVEEETLLEDSLIVEGIDGVYFQGTSGQGAKLRDDGESGPGLLWYPRKAALRAGDLWSHSGPPEAWDDANIGYFSTAFGRNTSASAPFSFAANNNTLAAGTNSASFGVNSHSAGGASMAGGLGSSTASNAPNSLAWGFWASANSANSLAFGNAATTTGTTSVALNTNTESAGVNSLAAGFETRAEAFASVAFGRHNVGGGTPNTWESEDPVFEIGNGADAANPSNALTVYKSGDTEINGRLTVSGEMIMSQAQGDILMGQFGN